MDRRSTTARIGLSPGLEVAYHSAAMTDSTSPSTDQQSPKRSWFTRLRDGLSRSSARLAGGITALFTRKRLDRDTLDELEDLLITADLGPSTAAKLIEDLARHKLNKDVSEEEVRQHFAGHISRLLDPVSAPFPPLTDQGPTIILVVGVNGVGKTTTIGKLARQYTDEGKKVMLAAGDTFRAAAIDQLKIWGDRTNSPVVAKDTGADAAGLAFDAVTAAKEQGVDVLLVDTAGRLHNKKELMDELSKIVRVIGKVEETAPHHVLLVLDATTGQNARSQVEVFREMVSVSGLVVTKLDGSAKGGILVALADQFELPVHAIGVGEGAEDLRPFSAQAYADSLMGLSGEAHP